MKKLPYGISNYEEIVRDGYYYVDKTMYIEKLENGLTVFIIPRKNIQKKYIMDAYI